jgi:hypothetical protein
VSFLLLACVLGAVMPLRAAPLGQGFTLSAQTRVAAFHVTDAPSVLVHAPPGFDPKPPLHLVVFLHGFNGCVEVLAASGPARCRPSDSAERDGYSVVQEHDRAGTNTLLVIPQLAFLRRDGKPGCFDRPGCFRRFLDELLGETLAGALGGARSLHDVASLTLVAHSAGYRSALAILQRGEVSAQVHAVVLLDALYGEAEAYAHWLASSPPDVRFLSLYLGYGKTYIGSRTLLRLARRSFGADRVAQLDANDLPAHVAPRRLIIAEGHIAHRDMPRGYLATVLQTLDLPARVAH